MYLLDPSAIITPFHDGQLRALSAALKHKSLQDTQSWLENWFRRGFSSGILTISREVYEEVVEKCKNKKRKRPEYSLLKDLWEKKNIVILEPTGMTWNELKNIHEFVVKSYEVHQAQKFLEEKDPMLIALAKTHKVSLVAEERHFIPEVNGVHGLIKGKVHLPYIAWAFRVRCIGFLTLLQEVGF